MNDKLSEIVFVLDISGSMSSVRQEAIGGFNRFLSEQQHEPNPANFTFILFDDQYEERVVRKPIGEVLALTWESYVPRGMTALNDALGKSITGLGARLAAMPEAERPAHVIFAVLTDGMENASHEYTTNQLADMIDHQQEVYNWQFIFLASDPRATHHAEDLGIYAANNVSYDNSRAGTEAAFTTTSNLVSGMRNS